MKTKIVETKVVEKLPFPKLMAKPFGRHNFIVLVLERERGVVVVSGDSVMRVGHMFCRGDFDDETQWVELPKGLSVKMENDYDRLQN